MVPTSPVSKKPLSSIDVVVFLEIGPRDGKAAHLDAAEGLAVPRQRLVGIVGDLHLDAERRVALLLLHVQQRVAREVRQLRLDRADGAERAHLGHAPGVEHLNAVILFEGLDHGARAGRAADHDAFQIRKLAAGLFQMLQQQQPDRRHGAGAGDLVFVEQFVDRGAVELRARHDQRRAGHRRRESEPPSCWRGTSARSAARYRATKGRSRPVAATASCAARSSGANRPRPSDGRWCRRCNTCRRRYFHRTSSRRNRRQLRRATSS